MGADPDRPMLGDGRAQLLPDFIDGYPAEHVTVHEEGVALIAGEVGHEEPRDAEVRGLQRATLPSEVGKVVPHQWGDGYRSRGPSQDGMREHVESRRLVLIETYVDVQHGNRLFVSNASLAHRPRDILQQMAGPEFLEPLSAPAFHEGDLIEVRHGKPAIGIEAAGGQLPT